MGENIFLMNGDLRRNNAYMNGDLCGKVVYMNGDLSYTIVCEVIQYGKKCF